MPEHQQIHHSKKPDPLFKKQMPSPKQISLSNPMAIIQRAKINPKSLTHAEVMQLQRTIGNRIVGKLLSEIGNPSKVQQVPIQLLEVPEEEEPLQGNTIETIQRQEIPKEEEPLQGKMVEPIQRQPVPKDEEKLQMNSVMQRQEIPEEEEPLQGKFETIQRLEPEDEEKPQMKSVVQKKEISEEKEPLQTKRENNTGMPDNLKAGVENLSGIDMSDVRVHYNSSKPAEVGALAYTQGTNIHVAPGQERHLPHEAWHVVQQNQGRVRPTIQMKDGIQVNDDEGLEHEANAMGVKALASIVQLRVEPEEEKLLQGEFGPVKRQGSEEEELLQGMWGDFDAKDRSAVRNILVKLNLMDSSHYELAGALERMIHEGVRPVKIYLALRLTIDYITVPRVCTLVTFLTSATPIHFAMQAIRVCPQNDRELFPLLNLFKQFHASGLEVPTLSLAKICSALLTDGKPENCIINVVRYFNPLLTTVHRAIAIMEHQKEGGTYDDARLATDFANDDDTMFANALKDIRSLSLIPSFCTLTREKKVALLKEQGQLETYVLLTNAVAVAVAATDAAAAEQILQQTRNFGYRMDFLERAQMGATAYKRMIEETESQRIKAKFSQSQIKLVVHDTSTVPSRKERRTAKKAEKDIEQAREEIKKQEMEALKVVTTKTGPEAFETMKKKYYEYFKLVNFNPDALLALNAAQEDFELATQIIKTLSFNQTTKELFQPLCLKPEQIRLLIDFLPAKNLTELVVKTDHMCVCQAYSESAKHVKLLAMLMSKRVPYVHIHDLVPQLVTLCPYVTNLKETSHLVTLLNGNTPAEVVAMCQAMPAPLIGKMEILAKIRPKAVSVDNLISILTLCRDLRLEHEEIIIVFDPFKNVTPLASLKEAIYTKLLYKFNKFSEFHLWLNSVDVLIRLDYLTITSGNDGWVLLEGDPLTYERQYNIRFKSKGTFFSTLYVHYHPNASLANTSQPWASKSHLKLKRDGNVRYLDPNQLTHVIKFIELRPPK